MGKGKLEVNRTDDGVWLQPFDLQETPGPGFALSLTAENARRLARALGAIPAYLKTKTICTFTTAYSATVLIGGQQFSVSYTGGGGNDVVLAPLSTLAAAASIWSGKRDL